MSTGAAPLVFDRTVVRQHRDRAARLGSAEFLFEQASEDMIDRLAGIRRSFATALIVGARRGALAALLGQRPGIGQRSGIGQIVQADFSAAMARCAHRPDAPSVMLDEEMLPFADHSLDLILSPLALHWVNDLPGALAQMRRALKPDGLLMASLLGGATLGQLRETIMAVEMEMLGGASPRISPAIDLRDVAGLMQRAGFSLPVADTDLVEVRYECALALLRDLRAMGETGALVRRDRRIPPRAFWPAVVEKYHRLHAGQDGRITARFEIFTLTGWHPHDSQQKPLRPGSGRVSLADTL